jgi:hypothetical protein
MKAQSQVTSNVVHYYLPEYSRNMIMAASAPWLVADPTMPLQRVVILARHGTKVPALDVIATCPALKPTLDAFKDEQSCLPGMLTPAGMRQLRRSGDFARSRYVDEHVLPASYLLNGSFSFTSQRDPFCLQSSTAFTRGLFPKGDEASIAAGAPEPPVVPVYVEYGKVGEDVLLNCRDGPCASAWSAQIARMSLELYDKFYSRWNGTLAQLSAVCGSNLVSAKLEQIKGLVDALDWAAEAAVYSVGDELEITSRRSVREMGLWLVQNLFVGTGTTLAVSACGFPRRLLETIAAVPRGGPELAFYLNHRELLYGASQALGISDFRVSDDHPTGLITTGLTLFFEQYGAGMDAQIRLFAFAPAHHHDLDWYESRVIPLTVHGCDPSTPCAVTQLSENFATFVEQSGELSQVCGLSQQKTSGATSATAGGRGTLSVIGKDARRGACPGHTSPDDPVADCWSLQAFFLGAALTLLFASFGVTLFHVAPRTTLRGGEQKSEAGPHDYRMYAPCADF